MPQKPYYCLPSGTPQITDTGIGLVVTQTVNVISADGRNVGSDSATASLPAAAADEAKADATKATVKLLLDGEYKRITASWEAKDTLQATVQAAIAEMQV